MPFAVVLSVLKTDHFLIENNPFKTLNGAHGRPPCLLTFILVVSSSDSLLVVSTLDILRFLYAAVLSILKMGPFLLGDNLFKTVKGLVDYV